MKRNYLMIIVVLSLVQLTISCSDDLNTKMFSGSNVSGASAEVESVSLIKNEASQSFSSTVDRIFLGKDYVLDKDQSTLQAKRTEQTVEYNTGLKGERKSSQKSLREVRLKPLDILIVVDDSGSMRDEQIELAKKMTKLLENEYVRNSEWKIGIITTSYKKPCLAALIEKDKFLNDNELLPADPVSSCDKTTGDKKDTLACTFYNSINGLGLNGGDHEQAILQAMYGFSQTKACPSKTEYANWLRPGSTIVLVIVSDEDNCSSGPSPIATTSTCYTDPKTYRDKNFSYLETNFGEAFYTSYLASPINAFKTFVSDQLGRSFGTEFRVYGIVDRGVNQDGTGAKECSGNIVAKQYVSLVRDSNGTSGSVCAASYSDTLSAISTNIEETIVTTDYVIDDSEVPYDVKVSVGKDENSLNELKPTVDYTVDLKNKAIHILDEQKIKEDQNLRLIKFEYYDYKNMKNKFSLKTNEPVLENSVRVEVIKKNPDGTSNMELIPSSDYQLKNNVVEFNDYPDENLDLRVSYKSASESLPKDFNFEPVRVKEGSVEVFINGTKLETGYVFDEKNFILHLDEAPEEGSDIKLSYIELKPLSFTLEEVDPEAIYNYQIWVDDKVVGPMNYKVVGNVLKFNEDFLVDQDAEIKIKAYKETL